jgi:chaperonin GroES
MNFKPLGDRVAIKILQQQEKTAGGIIIPDSAKEKPIQGEIVAVGNGVRDDSGNMIQLEVKIGDKVLFGKWAGTEVEVDNQKLLVMKESDIMGIIN